MKRLTLLFGLVLLVALAACGGQEPTPTVAVEAAPTEAPATEAPATAVPAPEEPVASVGVVDPALVEETCRRLDTS